MNEPEPPAPKYVTIGEAARRLGVSTATIRRWADAGRLASTRPFTGTHRRILKADVDAAAAAMEPGR